MRRTLLIVCAFALAAISFCLLLWPGFELSRALLDRNLGWSEPAAQAWRWHRSLAPACADWARERIANGAAARLSMHDIAGTE